MVLFFFVRSQSFSPALSFAMAVETDAGAGITGHGDWHLTPSGLPTNPIDTMSVPSGAVSVPSGALSVPSGVECRL